MKAVIFRKPYNVRVIPDAGEFEIVGADTIAKLSAETSEPRANAAWDQRIVIPRFPNFVLYHDPLPSAFLPLRNTAEPQ